MHHCTTYNIQFTIVKHDHLKQHVSEYATFPLGLSNSYTICFLCRTVVQFGFCDISTVSYSNNPIILSTSPSEIGFFQYLPPLLQLPMPQSPGSTRSVYKFFFPTKRGNKCAKGWALLVGYMGYPHDQCGYCWDDEPKVWASKFKSGFFHGECIPCGAKLPPPKQLEMDS